jgi:7-keto-8-aminopelargonate synthetase-like enzyme
MSKQQNFYDTVNQIISYGKEKNILQLYTSGNAFNGCGIIINNRPVLNFGSCSYLGLEFHPALKKGAVHAIENYGTQFSESRAYVSLGLYKELEQLMEKIFDAPVVITPTTTLGHIACVPVIVEDEDAVIMDHQLHNSVQTAVQLVKARGVHIQLIRHNRMDLLEESIKALRHKHRKIWYMADGIYSMFGDACPVDAVYALLDKYPELHFYADDAHGMSIHGKHGRGYLLANRHIHPKMIMASSLNKAFASGGGVLVFGDAALAVKTGNVGGPLLSSGPMQPGSLGAAIAAATIHLSKEIVQLQQELKDNIEFTRLLLAKYKLPVISQAGAAIFFVGVSLPKLGHNIVRQMLDKGYYVNLGIFPTVPMKQTGIRFTITRLHSFAQIEQMISTLAAIFPVAMKEEGIRLFDIYKAFKLPMPEEVKLSQTVDDMLRQTLLLDTIHCSSIMDIDKTSWNQLFSGKGSFDWEGMALLEAAFTGNTLPEDNWHFDYLIIKNRQGDIIAATFFTTAIWKDDMLAPAAVSAQVEQLRLNDPYHLTSKVVCCGSLLTEGEHLFLNRQTPLWKDALQLVFEKAYSLQENYHASQVVFRDFHQPGELLDQLMTDNGFFRIQLPDSYQLPVLDWNSELEFSQQLSVNARRQFKRKVIRQQEHFLVQYYSGKAPLHKTAEWYRLYRNVKSRSLELNTFQLPEKLFQYISENPNWEITELTIRDTNGKAQPQPCCMVLCNKNSDAFIPMIIGIDYRYNKVFNIYRQALYQVICRARQLQKQSVLLGFSAGIEKQKLGAVPVKTYAYLHTTDSYNAQAIASLSMLIKTNK